MGLRKKILLTGATGTIGLEVLTQLYQKKEYYEVIVFDVKSPKATQKLAPFKKGVHIVYGDITNANDLMKVSFDKDVVIHLAAIIPPIADDKPRLSYQVNTIGTKNLVQSLELNSPNAFLIYSSSVSVYGDRLYKPMITINDPLKPSEGDAYAKTKIEAEEIIRNSKLNWSVFRLCAIMGGHKISKLMFHQPLETKFEIATPEDTARAFVNAIEKQEELTSNIFNLGGGENCRIRYHDFLSQSFKIHGLGKLDFPPKTFAEKNFHCGYYKDGDKLNTILNFRKDTLESYFKKEKNKVSYFKKTITSIFKNPIKRYLQKQSEPLIAYLNQDKELMKHFFDLTNKPTI